ncbi:ABC transporter permease subunit [Gordonia hydrophobica]|uniref:ABC transporter permease subunit n=1 Tax=Gordonia hydrophobica TaxID=40516 RepID=A0ABZ2TZ78_9ACTN|nr:ABC transporter permease subunit [Gordonia hydrophobica]MBM7368903.1 ABC-2 type transport system permease protein [Gordonia hydrophobica]
MTATAVSITHETDRAPVRVPGLVDVLRSEWIKLASVRSTWWTLGATVILGAGLTVILCAANAAWLAGGTADESPGSFITWGMMIAQICAVVLGALCVTSEYSTGMIQATFAAVPSRGTVMLAKSVLITTLMFVVGTATALLGYVGGNYFLSREGIGLPLAGDVLRSMYGSGLFLACIALLSVGVGFIARHTAGTITLVLAVILILGNMVMMVPGTVGDWLGKLMPGNAGQAISSPVPFNPELLSAWPGLAVLVAEVAVVLAIAWVLVRRRDA